MNSEIVREGVACGISDAIDCQQNNGNLPTLRDRFAMVALQGLLSSQGRTVNPEGLAAMAYEQADAMLAARCERGASS